MFRPLKSIRSYAGNANLASDEPAIRADNAKSNAITKRPVNAASIETM